MWWAMPWMVHPCSIAVFFGGRSLLKVGICEQSVWGDRSFWSWRDVECLWCQTTRAHNIVKMDSMATKAGQVHVQ